MASGDAVSIAQQAHKIKGAAGAVGGEALWTVASAMEQAGKAGDAAAASAQMTELENQFAQLEKALTREINPAMQAA